MNPMRPQQPREALPHTDEADRRRTIANCELLIANCKVKNAPRSRDESLVFQFAIGLVCHASPRRSEAKSRWTCTLPAHTARALTNALSCLNSGAAADSHHSNNTASAVEIVAPLLAMRSRAVW